MLYCAKTEKSQLHVFHSCKTLKNVMVIVFEHIFVIFVTDIKEPKTPIYLTNIAYLYL